MIFSSFFGLLYVLYQLRFYYNPFILLISDIYVSHLTDRLSSKHTGICKTTPSLCATFPLYLFFNTAPCSLYSLSKHSFSKAQGMLSRSAAVFKLSKSSAGMFGHPVPVCCLFNLKPLLAEHNQGNTPKRGLSVKKTSLLIWEVAGLGMEPGLPRGSHWLGAS